MCKFTKTVLVILCTVIPSYAQQNSYESGLELLKNGKHFEALVNWEECKKNLEIHNRSDPRIGISYIATVTAYEIEELYESAADMYYWGFSGSNSDEHIDTIVNQAKMIVPLLEDEKAKLWNRLIIVKSERLASKVRGYWLKNDPLPSGASNERLIEHWKRIVHSRKYFTKSKSSPYFTDDRGTIYVKYGPPEKNLAGNFGVNLNELNFWLAEFGDHKIIDRFAGRNIDKTELESLQTLPEFEIWIYNYATEKERVYIFGTPYQSGFSLVNAVEELIPQKLFKNRYSLVKGGKSNPLSVGGLFQLMYYKRVETISPYFAQKYDELYSEWTRSVIGTGRPPYPGVINGFKSRNIIDDKTNPLKLYGPKYNSVVDDSYRSIKVHCHIFRKLKNNKPELMIVAMSYPSMEGMVDAQRVILGTDYRQDYNLIHTLKVHDSNWNEIGRIDDTIEQSHDNTSVFMVDHKQNMENFILAAAASPKRTSKSLKQQTGKSTYESILPLDPDEKKLELSDIVSGIPVPNDDQNKEFLFPVLPANEIQKGDDLMVYFEVYHLLLGQNGTASYDVEFSIEYKKVRRMRKDKMERISQKTNFTSRSITSRVTTGFDLSELPPGEYEFKVEVLDKNSGQKKNRSGKFKLISEEKIE